MNDVLNAHLLNDVVNVVTYSVHTPLLGAGAGWLDAEVSLEAMRFGLNDYLEEAVHPQITFSIFVHEPERYVSLGSAVISLQRGE